MRDQHNKMSKRHGDPSYEDLIAQGYLTPAVLNYCLLYTSSLNCVMRESSPNMV